MLAEKGGKAEAETEAGQRLPDRVDDPVEIVAAHAEEGTSGQVGDDESQRPGDPEREPGIAGPGGKPDQPVVAIGQHAEGEAGEVAREVSRLKLEGVEI